MHRITKNVVTITVLLTCVFALVGVGTAQMLTTHSLPTNMQQARTGAAAVLLPDGRILITGGADSNGTPRASSEFYNPSTGTFSSAPSMHEPRANHAAIVLKNGSVLVTGGRTSGGFSDSAEIFNPKSGSWSLLDGSLGTGRAGHTMAILRDGNVIIAGGKSTSGTVGSLVIFNVGDKTISHAGSLLTGRTDAVAAALPDGRILIAGGTDRDNKVLASTEIFKYDPQTHMGAITAGPTMSSPRTSASATSTYDGVAIVGGHNGHNDLGTADIFDGSTNRFTVANGGTPRSGHFAALLPGNGHVLILGGTGGASADLLQPWGNNKAGAFLAPISSFSNHSGGFASPSLRGSLLAGGGSNRTAQLYGFPTVALENGAITGAGFKAGEQVDLHMHSWMKQSTTDAPDATVKADSKGGFSYPGTASVGTHVTAVGRASGIQAQGVAIPFSSSFKVGSVSVGAQTGTLTYGTVSTATYTVTVTQGSPGTLSVDLTVSGLPTGVTGSFGATTPVAMPGTSGGTGTATLTLTNNTGLPTTGSTFTVKATNAQNGQSSDNKSTTGTVVIGARAITITGGSLSATTYDGTAHNISACTSSDPTFVTCTNSVSSVTDAGTGSVVPTATYVKGVAADYSVTPFNGSYEIDKRGVNITGGSLSATPYNGGTQNVSACQSSDPTFVTCSNSQNSVGPDVGSGSITPTANYVQGNANDYNVASTSGSWQIITMGVNLTAGSQGPSTYNGNAQTVSACSSSAPTFVQCNNSTSSVGPDAGSGSISVTPSYLQGIAADYNISTTSGSYEIDKADPGCSVSAMSGLTYNGFMQPTATGTCAGVPGGVTPGLARGHKSAGIRHFTVASCTPTGAGLDLSGTCHKHAGVYPGDSWSYIDTTGDYNNTTGTVDDSIGTAAVTATAGSLSGATYTGSAQSPSACQVTGAFTGDLTCSNSVDPAGPNAGSGVEAPVINYNGDLAGDFSVTPVSGSWSIGKALATIVVTPYKTVYNGNQQCATATATGVQNEDLSAALNLANTCHTNAGVYNDKWQFLDLTGNYKFASGIAGDWIQKANGIISVTPLLSTYNGQAQHAMVSVMGIGSDGDLTNGGANVSFTSQTAAGSYPGDVWTFTSTNSNYNNATGKTYDVIKKATATVVSVTPLKAPFNGQAQHATVVLQGVNGDGAALTAEVVYTNQTNAGIYAGDVWTFTDSNYLGLSGKTYDVITRINATITVTPYSVAYDGNVHCATGVALDVNGNPMTGLDLGNSDPSNLSGTCHQSKGNYVGDVWTFTSPDPNYFNGGGKAFDSIH